LIGDGNASDRYFRGRLAANVADNQYRPDPVPVYAADRFELIINLKTAKMLGLTIWHVRSLVFIG
jgi:hypothetical protein